MTTKFRFASYRDFKDAGKDQRKVCECAEVNNAQVY